MAEPKAESVNTLVREGYPPLVAMILAARGIADGRQAKAYLNCDGALPDAFLMTDMVPAVKRISEALERGERIAVFGDYDVDGITATSLLTDFLRSMGADCIPYIPGRLEEGYGLNAIAIDYLSGLGVRLIITVDCGITAIEEAQLCKSLGIDLIITDHHECKEILPEAVAVLDPHRPDGGYPHKNLSGVGVAFKLAAALSGSQQKVLDRYGDMLCLGTVADVMNLQGENRLFVAKGLAQMRENPRVGVAALMEICGCADGDLSASSVGYILAPRINAAGRMGQIQLALELFLTEDKQYAHTLAEALCDLNRQRQSVEMEIYDQAISMLPEDKLPEAVVLADDSWHQGVVGIVASRIAEEYCCPAILICLDGEHGKASSRSYGGFNLFAALKANAHLLESYGGHELAAGFTIRADKIAEFRQALCAQAGEYYSDGADGATLSADCAISPELFTLYNVDSLKHLEPCGNGCPKPLLVMEQLEIERISQVGGGRHMRLRLRKGHYCFNAIYFSANGETACVRQGDVVDVVFSPQVNEFRGERTVQMNITDIRPSCIAPCCPDTENYRALRRGTLTAQQAADLLPDREVLGTVWRYLVIQKSHRETAMSLCRKIVRWSGKSIGLSQMMTCLDIFADVGLVDLQRQHRYLVVRALVDHEKTDLMNSPTMQYLLQKKESGV